MVVLVLVGALVAAFVIAGVAMLPAAFLAMLLLGGLHSDVSVVPALGFWTVFKVLWLVSIVGSCLKGADVKASTK